MLTMERIALMEYPKPCCRWCAVPVNTDHKGWRTVRLCESCFSDHMNDPNTLIITKKELLCPKK